MTFNVEISGGGQVNQTIEAESIEAAVNAMEIQAREAESEFDKSDRRDIWFTAIVDDFYAECRLHDGGQDSTSSCRIIIQRG